MSDRCQGKPDLRRPYLLMAAALFCFYAAVFGGHLCSSDGMLMYRQAVALATNHSVQFPDYFRWGASYNTSKYGIGLSLLYTPGVWLFSKLGLGAYEPVGNTDYGCIYLDFLYTMAGAPLHLFIAVATAYVLGRFCRHLGFNTETSLAGMLLFGLGSPALIYMRGDFAQPLIGLCLLVGVYSAGLYGTTRSRACLLLLFFSVVLGLLARPVEGTLGCLCFALILGCGAQRNGRLPVLRGLAALILGMTTGGIITLLVNYLRYGHPLLFGYQTVQWQNPVTGLLGLSISPARGILFAFPSLVLAPWGLGYVWRSPHRSMIGVIVMFIMVFYFVMARWWCWWGGWCWGPRMLVPILPLLAIFPTAFLASHAGRGGRLLFTGLYAGVWVDFSGPNWRKTPVNID